MKYIILFTYISLCSFSLHAQKKHYSVELAPFCSFQNEEFAPVYYKDGLVFCSDKRVDLFITFSTPTNKELLNMFYVPLKEESNNQVQLLSESLMTHFNDGPASFALNDTLIVYSRNTRVSKRKKDYSDPDNTLGLFFSSLKDSIWSEAIAFTFNNANYNLTMPSINEYGNLIYFASDMPGGYGGLDIYFTYKTSAGWSKPQNLGEKINTSGNECYPFISRSGALFFSSNKHNSKGGLDIYYSLKNKGLWEKPVQLASPINTEFDDFGLITDLNFEKGYFSTNRNGKDDIFSFKTLIPQLENCDSLKQNQYCYVFYDEQYIPVDTTLTYYEWDFGNGIKSKGKEAEHCFEKAGAYKVDLNIVDKKTGEVFVNQNTFEFEIIDYEQAFIDCQDEYQAKNELFISATKTNLPTMDIQAYYWDLGDGNLMTGEEIFHAYQKPGHYNIKLGVESKADENGKKLHQCVMKELLIYDRTNSVIIKKAKDSDNEKISEKRKLNDKNEYHPILLVFTSDIRRVIKSMDNNFFISAAKKHEYEINQINNQDWINDPNNNPALAIYQEQADRQKIKLDKEEQALKLSLKKLSDEYNESINKSNKKELEESSHAVLFSLAQFILSNSDVEIKIGVTSNSIDKKRFERAAEEVENIVDYLLVQGIEEYRLRSVVYSIEADTIYKRNKNNVYTFELICD
ncbi:PKD domain-containing protein [Marinifilum sp. RC60d5]|uniref:PKD domain-containing protein n=1 Tax=Marinifilum sp. RC60d5 TaxID=3458414 RepID=UPI00403740C6